MKKKKKYLNKLTIMTLATSLVAFLGITTTSYKKAEATTSSVNINVSQTTSAQYVDGLYTLDEYNNTINSTTNIRLTSKRYQKTYYPNDDGIVQLTKNISTSQSGNIEIFRIRPNAYLTTMQYHRKVQMQISAIEYEGQNYTYNINYITHVYKLPYGNSELDYLFNANYRTYNLYQIETELSENVRLNLDKYTEQMEIGETESEDTYSYIEKEEIYDFEGNQNYNSYLIIFNYVTYNSDDPDETHLFNATFYNNTEMWKLNNKKISAYKITNENVSVDVINIPDIMFQILTMPFTFISMAFNLTLFAGTQYQINISSLLLGILAVIIFVLIIRMLIKMGK